MWLASGQSNMGMPLAGWGKVLDYQTEIARADYPEIGLFKVERGAAVRPQTDVGSSEWHRCSPESVAEFSAAAYFFGRRLHRELGVPVGLVLSSWGGTVAEAWTSAGALESLDDFRDAARAIAGTTEAELDERRRAWDRAIAERRATFDREDQGLAGGRPLWVGPDVDDAEWPILKLPTKWEDAGYPSLDGVVWMRREVDVPAHWVGNDLSLGLAYVEDDDETFFNGVAVGRTQGWATRRYRVPGELVRAGRNVIAVRVMDVAHYGGIWGELADLALDGPDGESIPLAGPWRFRIGLEFEPLGPAPDDPNRPTVLYNSMIAPLAPYAIRGVIWYQGESNAERAHQYRSLFPALIRDWRTAWGRDDLPFFFVQLAAFLPVQAEPGESAWAELREAQAQALALPATGMAVAIDIGDAADVHPKNKQDVGNRLARLALARVYGRDVADSGPIYREMTREGSRIRIAFDHARGGLEARGGALRGFAIAGRDRKFRWADARIEGDTVVVWSDAIAEPVAVRYGWADNPICNLVNAAGLPASPFRTDDWPGITRAADGD